MRLVDTNVLVYAVSPAEPVKQARDFALLEELARSGDGCLAFQSCVEFLSAAAVKRPVRLSLDDALDFLENGVLLDLRLLLPTAEVLPAAVRVMREHGVSFWDALIFGVARTSGVTEILSEDGPSGSTVEGIRYTNPFA